MLPVEAPGTCDCVRQIREEYLELPALHMTKAQIRRRWGLDPATCDEAVEALVSAHFLKADRGQYVRHDCVSECSPRD